MYKKKIALITGITGQDGSYLLDFLLDKDYEVHGIKRRSSNFNTQRIDHLYQDPHNPEPELILHYGDLTDSTNIIKLIQELSTRLQRTIVMQSYQLIPKKYFTPLELFQSLPMEVLRSRFAIKQILYG